MIFLWRRHKWRLYVKTRFIASSEKAFTLLELLLGLAIFTVIATSLYSTLWHGIKINQRAEQSNSLYREARWAMERIGQDLEKMVFYNFVDSYEDKKAFEGDDEEITFIVAEENGLRVVRYHLGKPDFGSIHKTVVGSRSSRMGSIVVRSETTSDAKFLLREEMSFVESLESSSRKKEEAEILSIRVKKNGLKFFYAHQAGDKDNPEIKWKDEWEYEHLPFGIRVEMTFLKDNPDHDDLVLTRDILIPTGSLGEEEF